MRGTGESRNIPAAILGAVFGTTIALLVCMAFAHVLNLEKYDTANRVILCFIVATTFIVPIAGGIEGGLRDGVRGAVGGSLMFSCLYALCWVVFSIFYELLTLVGFHLEALVAIPAVLYLLWMFHLFGLL